MMPAPSHLLYLHGFRSSPQSYKALRLQRWLAHHRPDVTWACPQLPPSPRLAMQLAHQILASWPVGRFALLGSSLGGFYATSLAETWDCPAVLFNPAVDPARDLVAHVGEHAAHHDPAQRLEFRIDHLDELQALKPPVLTRPERYSGVIAKGDEVLDWREMVARYPGTGLRVVEGSDHGLSDFDDHFPYVLHFLQLTP